MRRRTLITVANVTFLFVCCSFAFAFDEWELQQQQFEMELRLQELQMRQMQQELKQQMQLIQQQLKMQQQQLKQELRQQKQDFKLNRETMKLGKLQMQQFELPRSLNSNLYMDTNSSRLITPPSIDPLIMSPRSSITLYRELNSPVSQTFHDLRQETLPWRSLEAGGLTHIRDHIEMFEKSIGLIGEGLKNFNPRPEQLEWGWTLSHLGPGYLSSIRQLEWKIIPPKLGPDIEPHRPLFRSSDFGALLKGVTLGSELARGIWWDMEQGYSNWRTSHTLEAIGSVGIKGLIYLADGLPVNSALRTVVGKYLYGAPELMKAGSLWAGSGIITPEVKSSALRGIGNALSGLMWSGIGTTAFYFGEKLSTFAGTAFALPQARKIISQEYANYVNRSQLRQLPVQNMIDLFGPKYLRSFGYGADILEMPINRHIDLGTSRIDQLGIIRQSRLFDPDTGVTTLNRQWSITTREMTSPSFSNNRIFPQTNWSTSQTRFDFPKPKIDKIYIPTFPNKYR